MTIYLDKTTTWFSWLTSAGFTLFLSAAHARTTVTLPFCIGERLEKKQISATSLASDSLSAVNLCMKPNTVRLIPNASFQPYWYANDGLGGETLIVSGITWTSSAPSIVSVNGSGVFTSGGTLGEATITASWNGLTYLTKVKVVQDFSSPPADKRVVKVAMIMIDPQIPAAGSKRFSETFWPDLGGPMKLAQQTRDSMFSVSGGTIDYQFTEIHQEPTLLTKFGGVLLTVDSMYRLFLDPNWTTLRHVAEDLGQSEFLYNDMLNKYDLCNKSNNHQIDEVWIWAMPFMGLAESNMTGTGAFWINGRVISGNACTDLLPMMGFNYERYAGCALHNFTHRIETTMYKVFNDTVRYVTTSPPYPAGVPKDPLQTFMLYDALETGNAHLGNSHFPPNGAQNYDYANMNNVVTHEPNWKRYPYLFDQTKTVNCTEWGCEYDCGLNFMSYWMRHIPHFKCKDKTGILNNWWSYVIDYNEGKALEAQTANCNCKMFDDEVVAACDHKGAAPWELWISKVQFNTINNASDKFKDFATLGYSDFTNLSTIVSKGQTYELTVTPGLSWSGYLPNVYCRVWIDYNGDNIFQDSELVFQNTNASPFTGNVRIPASAIAGVTKMRVAVKWGGYPDPCETFDKGEVEDYTVNLFGIATKFVNITLQNWSPPQSGSPGQTLSSTFDAVSNGTLPVSSFPVGVFLSSDNIWGPNDQLLGAYTTPPIGIGTAAGLTFPFSIPASIAPGSYFLILRADIADQNPNDNIIVRPFTVQSGAANYCESKGVAPWELWISKVQFNTISNASDKFKDYATLGYSDFSALSTTIPKILPQILTVTPGLSWQGNLPNAYCRVWIDFNNNHIFESNELVFQSVNANPFSGNIVAPFDAIDGPVRMRVAVKWGNFPDPCELFDRGEVEDYTVNLSGVATKWINVKLQNWSAPQSAAPGQTLNSIFDVVSNGTLPVYSFPVGVYLSSDNVWSPNDLLVGAYTTPFIGIGTVAGLSFPFTIPSNVAPGAYFLILRADIADRIPEDNILVQPFVVQSGAANYCASKGVAPWEQWIEQVSIAAVFANSSFPKTGKEGYGDFTQAPTATLARGQGALITISPKASWGADPNNARLFWRVWVDWNNDQVFDDAELIRSAPVNISNGIFLDNQISFTVPATAKLGKTRLRVSMKVGGYPSACETFDRGEVEDYSVNIVNPPGSVQASTVQSDLRAFARKDAVRMEWVQKSDAVVSFDVEKSNTGENFERIATLPSTNIRYYDAYDQTPTEGLNYYRLKMYLQNNETLYSSIQKVDFEKIADFSVFPNPALEEAYIDLKAYTERAVNISISDLSGKIVFNQAIDKATSAPQLLSLTGLANGAYFIRVQTKSKAPQVRKFMIIK